LVVAGGTELETATSNILQTLYYKNDTNYDQFVFGLVQQTSKYNIIQTSIRGQVRKLVIP